MISFCSSHRETMKEIKKYAILLIIVFAFLGLTACGKEKEKLKEDVSQNNFEEKILEYTQNYEKKITDDGKIQVSIIAPDFTKILDECDEEPDKAQICKILENEENDTKVYTFIVESENAIEDKFLDLVSYDLLVGVMGKVSIKEQWEVE